MGELHELTSLLRGMTQYKIAMSGNSNMRGSKRIILVQKDKLRQSCHPCNQAPRNIC